MPFPIAAAAILGGGLLGSSLLSQFGPSGQRARSAAGAQEDLANTQAALARRMFEDVQPLRESLFGTPETVTQQGLFEVTTPPQPGDLGTFLDTGELPVALQADVPFAAARDTLENQFGVARENLLSRIPLRGGQLNTELVDLERDRALGIADLALREGLRESDLRERVFGQTLQAATGGPVTASQALGSSAAQFGNVARFAAQQDAALGESIGSASALAAMLAFQGAGAGAGTPIPGLPFPLASPGFGRMGSGAGALG